MWRDKNVSSEQNFRAGTGIYKNLSGNIGQPKAVRESRCMDAQMATYFVTIQPQDLIAGRISRPYVVFAQCMEGDGIDKTGYCIDVVTREEMALHEGRRRLFQEGLYAGRRDDPILENRKYKYKIRQQFPKSWAGSMGGDDYAHDNAAIHPLYRLAGVNLDFKKLFRLGVCGLRVKRSDCRRKRRSRRKRIFTRA